MNSIGKVMKKTRTIAGDRQSFRIDRRIPGLGRLQVSSGTQSVTALKTREALLTLLIDKGRLDLLELLQSGQKTMAEVYAAHKLDRLEDLLCAVDAATPLGSAITTWLAKGAWKPETADFYQWAIARLPQLTGLGAQATIRDLGTVDFKQRAAGWALAGTSWNHTRQATSSFLSDTLGLTHPLRTRILKAWPKKVSDKGPKPDISMDGFWDLLTYVPEFYQAAFITMVLTGLRISEYLRLTKANLRAATCQVVPSGKTGHKDEIVPVDPFYWHYVEAAVPAKANWADLTYHQQRNLRAWYYKVLKKAVVAYGKPELTLHSLRHCFVQFCLRTGIPIERVSTLARHADVKMTMLYAAEEAKSEDAATYGHAMRKAQARAQQRQRRARPLAAAREA